MWCEEEDCVYQFCCLEYYNSIRFQHHQQLHRQYICTENKNEKKKKKPNENHLNIDNR